MENIFIVSSPINKDLRVCGDSDENGPHRLKFECLGPQLVELFDKD